jgi:pyridoxine/pyridoxamine 5'-phosphate oxidase
MHMTETELLAFLRSHHDAVQSSISERGTVQSALVAVAFSDSLEIVFDTIITTRKAANLKANPHISFVIGGWISGDERSVQYEGIAEFPEGEALVRAKNIYFAALPDGVERQSWLGISYVFCKPTWIRFSNFNVAPPEIVEFSFP